MARNCVYAYYIWVRMKTLIYINSARLRPSIFTIPDHMCHVSCVFREITIPRIDRNESCIIFKINVIDFLSTVNVFLMSNVIGWWVSFLCQRSMELLMYCVVIWRQYGDLCIPQVQYRAYFYLEVDRQAINLKWVGFPVCSDQTSVEVVPTLAHNTEIY